MISMRASGFTYNPGKSTVDKEGQVQHNFGRVEVNGIRKFYLDHSFKVKADNWNISVAWALRRYCHS